MHVTTILSYVCLAFLQHAEGLTWAAFMRHMAIGLCGIHPCVMVDLSLAAHEAQDLGHLLCTWILTGGAIGVCVFGRCYPDLVTRHQLLSLR